MAGDLQPLDEKFAIVGSDGRPTLYFIKWAQQRQIDIQAGITEEQALALIVQYLLDHQLQEGDGIALTPSGNISDSPAISVRNGTGLDFDGMQNLKLADTAVTPGTYGDATNVAQITIDQQGRITNAANVPISGGGGSGTIVDQANTLVITSNNVFQDTDLSIALTAGSYAIESFYTTSVNATPDMEVQFTYTGTVTDVAMIRFAARGSTTSAVEYVALPAVYNMDTTAHFSVMMHGQITVSTSGNFKVQARQVTSSGTSVSFLKASWLRITPL